MNSLAPLESLYEVGCGRAVPLPLFAPERPLWGALVSVKRGENHLFLRYVFEAKEHE